MNHKQKVKLARKMQMPEERYHRTPIFRSYQWMKRKKDIAIRVEKKQNEAHERAVARKLAIKHD